MPERCRLNSGTMPARCRLNSGTVPARCRFECRPNSGTVPARCRFEYRPNSCTVPARCRCRHRHRAGIPQYLPSAGIQGNGIVPVSAAALVVLTRDYAWDLDATALYQERWSDELIWSAQLSPVSDV